MFLDDTNITGEYQPTTASLLRRVLQETTSFTLNCRIVDQVGNIGNNTTISGFVDLQTPTTTILPMNGNTITNTTTITLQQRMTNSNGTSTATITWTNTTSSWNTTVAYNGTWNGSIAGLNSNLGDGSVSVSIIHRWFGNQQTESSGWTLNTTMVLTTFSLDTSHPDVKNVGNYVGDFVRFIATPPVWEAPLP